jgi:hypothetical protein
MERKLCELCEKRFGAYSNARRLFVCDDCWQHLGRLEARADALIAADYTGQDSERE